MQLVFACRYLLRIKANITEEEAFAEIRRFIDVNKYPLGDVTISNKEMWGIKRKRIYIDALWSTSTWPQLRFSFYEDDDNEHIYNLDEQTDWDQDRFCGDDNESLYLLAVNYFNSLNQEGGEE